MRSLVVDAGNTRIKIAAYLFSELYDLHVFPFGEREKWQDFLKNAVYDTAIVSSVLNDRQTAELMSCVEDGLLLSENTPVPVTVEYDSRRTLGKDRLANAVAAYEKSRTNALVVDIGTCIKFDFVTSEGIFRGGSISPGLQMRFSAMHEFTGNLPLLKNKVPTKLIGNSTVNSMTSGVMNGAKYEIEGMINAYLEEFKDLVIFVTGGDADKLDLSALAPLNYDEHLTINGLYSILQKQNRQ